MEIGVYEKERDRDACLRIWNEVGWIESTEGKHAERAGSLFDAGRALVARIDGDAECLVLAAQGDLRYLDEIVSFSAVTGVTTSRVARRLGLAARLTARLIAEEAEAGAAVSGLGFFEQGFYDRLGYGTGTYEVTLRFDPASLKVNCPSRSPIRLGIQDYARMHASRLRRMRTHGSVSLASEHTTQGDMLEEPGFGLGFPREDGSLGHHVWFYIMDAENGPYRVHWMAYENHEELIELLGLIKSLGDQVRSVHLHEPAGIQLQDLLDRPIAHRILTRRSKFEVGAEALAWWQLRICDLERCLAQTHLTIEPLRFNLRLEDPIGRFLDDRNGWRGVGGEYTVTLGPESGIQAGADPGLPTLDTTVNAFSRMWLGVRPAGGLAVTERLVGPPELIAALDHAFRLPHPVRDWEF